MKQVIALLLSAALFAGCAGCKGGTQTEMKKQYDQAFYGTTASVDGKSFSPVSGYDGKKYVGMFYCLWNGDANETIPDDKTVYDVSRYEAENRIADTVYGGATPSGPAFHYWGEPLYGYYRSEDPWVIRRHLELFLHAGIDFLCFDTSNALIYEPRVRALLEVWQEYESLGYNVPKLMFMTNTDSEETVKKIYDAFYREGKYDGLWFRGEGNRPWILGVQPKDAPYRDAFYFKRAQWPNDPAGIDPDKFPWISWSYPQEKHSDAQLGTIMSVSVAQHVGLAAKGNGVSADFSDSALCSPANRDSLPQALAARVGSFDKIYNANWGRGYSHKDADPHNDAPRISSAVNFEEQFETALDGNAGVDCIFVLGWNEWVAQKQPGSSVFGDGVNHFVDLFNMEFSRDIEPMRGGYEDRYLMSLIRDVRAYKGNSAEGAAAPAVAKTYDMFGGDWQALAAVYSDFVGDTGNRSCADAVRSQILTDASGRNDIAQIAVFGDAENIWLRVETAEEITEPAGEHWMNVFLGTGGGWNGLEYAINRRVDGTKSSIHRIERTDSGWQYVDTGRCAEVRVSGRTMIVKVKKSDIGIAGGYALQFKVTDNVTADFDLSALYTEGDCAPVGRINYVYAQEG